MVISNLKHLHLDHFSRDLTHLSLRGDLDPVIGRENEIEGIIRILSRRKKVIQF